MWHDCLSSVCFHFCIIGTSQSNMHLSNWLIYLSLSWAEGFSVLKRIFQLGPCSFENIRNQLARSSKSCFAKLFLVHCSLPSIQHLILDTRCVLAVINAEPISMNRTLRLMPSRESGMKTNQKTNSYMLEVDVRTQAQLFGSTRTPVRNDSSHITCPLITSRDLHVWCFDQIWARAEPKHPSNKPDLATYLQ